LEIQKNISLKPYNTFGIECKASEYIIIQSIEDLKSILPMLQEKPFLFLGGGSNVLFTKDFDGLVIQNQLKGIDTIYEDENVAEIAVKSGEIWHDLVLWSLEKGFFGLENLSLIPGSVGAAPMQNIGAYGEEIKNWCTKVIALNLKTSELETFTNETCEFGYRESIFKRKLKNQYFIYEVHLKLDKKRVVNCNYGDIKKILEEKCIDTPSPKDVSNAVIEIRSSKLPNPSELGNAGSFFKNPVISIPEFNKLQLSYPEIPNYPDVNGIKIPAGWLIEQSGFKGKIVGNTGSHAKQALVIVNYGNATGIEIFNYSQSIIDFVKSKYGIELEREVNII
jgi:UDP-N-acetylmuramate dehydrogenase